MISDARINRRDFVKLALSTTATGFALGVSLPGCGRDATGTRADHVFRPNAWLEISETTGITVKIAEAEMGQGVTTSLSMLIAEELEVGLEDIRIQLAPASPEFGTQTTGSSTSIRRAWQPLRQAGAAARIMLLEAAAAQWGVAVTECRAQDGQVTHEPTDRSLPYTTLARAASRQSVPETVPLKGAAQYRLIGNSRGLVHSADKTSGKAVYGIDVMLPGMLYATVRHCPVFGGKLASFDDSKTRQIPGVTDVILIESGIAVVAENTWAAFQGADALSLQWDEGPHASVSSGGIVAEYALLAESTEGEIVREIEASAAPAVTTIDATYVTPFQAHTPMEPMNCTAFVRRGECDVWAPTQALTDAQRTALEHAFGRPGVFYNKVRRRLSGGQLHAVRVHPTLLGGGFGRRLTQDFVAEAVQISRAIQKPVKLTWSREEDMQHGWYRHLTHHRLTGGLDAHGNPVSWKHQIVGSSRYASVGGADDKPYAIPNVRVTYVNRGHSVPTGPWRSVGHSINGFVTEGFIDELAIAAKQDPYEYRLQLLRDAPRAKAVLQLAAEKGGWHEWLPAGTFRGISQHSSFGSHVAQVAEVVVSDDDIRVQRIVCAVDCGTTVNPNTVKAQIEGGIIFALTATLKSHITVEHGRVQQSGFHDFELLRFDESPVIEVHIVESDASPGGIGEVAVPPLAAAVTNALYAATGIRLRELPVSLDGLAQTLRSS